MRVKLFLKKWNRVYICGAVNCLLKTPFVICLHGATRDAHSNHWISSRPIKRNPFTWITTTTTKPYELYMQSIFLFSILTNSYLFLLFTGMDHKTINLIVKSIEVTATNINNALAENIVYNDCVGLFFFCSSSFQLGSNWDQFLEFNCTNLRNPVKQFRHWFDSNPKNANFFFALFFSLSSWILFTDGVSWTYIFFSRSDYFVFASYLH